MEKTFESCRGCRGYIGIIGGRIRVQELTYIGYRV